jgi:hypothetical protein
MRNAYRILVRKPERKIPPGRPRYRWEDNIKMNLGERVFGMWVVFVWFRIGTGGGLL